MRLTLVGFMIALIVAGAVRLRRRAPVTVLFMGLYLAVTLVWPYAPWRFVFAIWPLLLLFACEGGFAALEWRPRVAASACRPASAAALVIIALGILDAEAASVRDRAWRMPVAAARLQIGPLIRWIADNTSANDLLIADDEPLVYLMTGRQALPPASFTALEYVQPSSVDAATRERELRRLLAAYPARYLLTVVPATRDVARRVASATRVPRLREVSELANGSGAVFEVARP